MTPNKRLRIIHCFRSPVGGIFRHVRDLAEQHNAEGHQVGIVCDSTTGGVHEERIFESIRPHLALGLTRLPIRRAISPGDIMAAFASFQTIKRLQPDILHGHGAKGGTYARLIGSRLRVSGYRVARFYSPHGGSLHFSGSKPSGRLFFAIERLLERATDRIVFVSDYERRTYTEKVGAPRPLSLMVHNGLQPAEFEPVRADGNAVDFLYIGTMRDLKGPDIFIEAFAEAERRIGRPLSARMIGDGEDKPRYAAMLEQLGLVDRVTMHDAMPARTAFALARNVVIPSRAESMPYIVLEAIAAGMPVLATRVGGIPEILGSTSAALVPPADPVALGEMMAKVIETPDWLSAQMPDRSRFRGDFSVARMAEQIGEAYRSALAGVDAAPAAAPGPSNLS